MSGNVNHIGKLGYFPRARVRNITAADQPVEPQEERAPGDSRRTPGRVNDTAPPENTRRPT